MKGDFRPERISLGFIRRVRREDFCETGASGLAKEAEISNDGVFPTLSSSRKSLSLSLSLFLSFLHSLSLALTLSFRSLARSLAQFARNRIAMRVAL